MAKDTFSSDKGKKDESNSSKERTVQEAPSKKPASLQFNTTERPEKQIPSTYSVARKSERMERKNAPSPLRKSGKIAGPSSDTDQRKLKKEKSMEELTSPIRQCKPRMTGRVYRALFIRQPKKSEYLADQNGSKDNDTYPDDGNEFDRNNGKDMAETFAQVTHDDHLEQAVSLSPPSFQEIDHVEEVTTSPNAEEVGVTVTSCIADDENVGALKVGLEGKKLENPEPQKLVADLAVARKDADSSLKRKRDRAEAVPDTPAMVVNGDDCNMSHEGTIPSTSECKNDDHPQMCNMFQKRHKVNNDSANLANCTCGTKPDQEFDDCTTQDQGESEPAASKDFGETNEQIIQQDESHDYKADSSSYPEYWVPVQISDIQLEQYCAILLSNSLSLCSLSKNDPVRELHNILISARKTCDHPYHVDESVRSLVIKNLKVGEILDVEIKASGKLRLLDAMLTEIKRKGSKVVVFFQGLAGDLLDLFMRQRFGEPSFGRIDHNVSPSKKRCSMNKFNKESERFVLLLETRACSNTVKLSSVEAFILFDSSWNPVQDLRFIEKIKIESQSERTKIFRLYTSCTVEEKALLLARQNKHVAENPSRLVIHALLMWGSSYLFDKLEHFHSNQTSESGVLFERSIVEGVIDEILSVLYPRSGDKKKDKRYLILEAKYVKGIYHTDSALFGEEKVKLSDEDSPNIFWSKLLNQRSPTWRYCSVSQQRIRKRASYFEDSETSDRVANVRVAEKCKKAAAYIFDPPARHEEENAFGLKHVSSAGALESPRSASSIDNMLHVNDAVGFYSSGGNISEIPEDIAGNDGGKGLYEAQKGLHAALKLEMAKLFQVLHLSADVTSVAENFLEYVISNHRVCKEQTTELQAFQIAVCWVAATSQKQQLNRRETLALAKDHLAYGCSREVVDFIYSMLCCLRSKFLKSHRGSMLDFLPENSEQPVECTSRNQVEENKSQEMLLQEKNTGKACASESQACLSELRGTDYDSLRRDVDKSAKDIVKKWSKQSKKLQARHEEEKMELARNYEKAKSDLEKNKKAKALVINIAWRAGSPSKIGELKAMDRDFKRKFDQLKSQMDESLKNLEERHEAERKKLDEYEADQIKRMGRWTEDLLGGVIPSITSENAPDVAGTHNDLAGDVSGGYEEWQEANEPLAKSQNEIGTVMADNSQLDVPEMVRNGQEDTAVESRSSEPTSVTDPEICSDVDCQEKVAASNVLLSEDQVFDEVTRPVPNEDVTLRVLEMSQPLENGVSDDLPLNRVQALLLEENNEARNLNTDSAPSLVMWNGETCSPNHESPGELAWPLEHPVPGVESGGSAIPDQTAHDMCPPPFSPAGTEQDAAPNTESQNIKEAAEPSIAEPDPHEVEVAEASVAEPDTLQVEVAEPSVAEPDTPQVKVAEPSIAEPDPLEVEVAEPSVAERDPRQMELAEPAIAEPDHHEVEVVEHYIAEPDPRQMEVAESPCNSSNRVVSQNPETLFHHAENLVELVQEGIVELSAGVAAYQPATTEGRSMTFTDHIPQSSGLAALQMPLPLLGDPFQYEIEKIHREAETNGKFHEDTKTQLKTEFEIKMAEFEIKMVELRREYDIKFHEEDTKFQARAKELETYKNLIIMNKHLVDAFKSICSEPTTSITATSKDTNSGVVHLLTRQLTHAQAQRNNPAAPSRPSVTSMAPPRSQLTVSSVIHLPVPPVPHFPRPLVPPPQFHLSVPRVPPFPLPLVHMPQSQPTVSPIPAQRFSSVPHQSRLPPVITNTNQSPGSPSPATPYGYQGVRAPAPHLQSYRSSSSSPANINVQRAPSPFSRNSIPASIPLPEACEGPNTVALNLPPAGSAPTFSSMVVQQEQELEQGGGNSTGGVSDVVCLSDDD
ncbi:PREDICTED: helicase protein MOM1-like [Tarenaya hassleriana]|uniref:helicase protein MOM1-like n=1 Tax=Tarenaya hassleriana TaxID=28532 RepID=UPI00053C63C5|nr:PREDICTED: helicase protein MOM1-like [Tarenaya hassleriana]